jgi:ubiquinone/menaquinone biosynthesis C-methylase UbiE
MNQFYPEVYYASQKPLAFDVSKVFRYGNMRRIMRHKKNGRILDVGCGDGSFLFDFKQRNWDVYGVDISKISCRIAKKKLGNNIFNCELKNCGFPDQYYDVITLNHVLEHLPNPEEELREIRRILKDDGVVYAGVPNIDSLQFKICRESWLHLDLPRHTIHYTSDTVRGIFEKNGFRVSSVNRPLFEFPLDLFHSLRARCFSPSSKMTKTLASPALLGAGFLKLVPAWRSTLNVIARKA